jgi:hypothetical protein
VLEPRLVFYITFEAMTPEWQAAYEHYRGGIIVVNVYVVANMGLV